MKESKDPYINSNNAVGIFQERQSMALNIEKELQGTLEMLPLLSILKDNGELRYYEHRSLVLICRRYAQKLKDEIASTKDCCSHCIDYQGRCPYCNSDLPVLQAPKTCKQES